MPVGHKFEAVTAFICNQFGSLSPKKRFLILDIALVCLHYFVDSFLKKTRSLTEHILKNRSKRTTFSSITLKEQRWYSGPHIRVTWTFKSFLCIFFAKKYGHVRVFVHPSAYPHACSTHPSSGF